jgi:uncharacterized membrane protein YqjE
MESPRPPAGLAEALRGLAATLLEMVHTRAELALVELREEGERRKRMAGLVLVAALFLAMALLFAGGFVVAAFWDTHRLGAFGSVTAAYLAVALWALLRLRALLRSTTPPFQETLAALAADRELLRPDA